MVLRVMGEESYIVRIYRKQPRSRAVRDAGTAQVAGGTCRRAHDRVVLAGIVEDVEQDMRRYFRDIEELWAILSAAPGAFLDPYTNDGALDI